MIGFKEFITEQIIPKDDFLHDDPNNGIMHRANIKGNSVLFAAIRDDDEPDHATLNFLVNGSHSKKSSNIKNDAGAEIYHHVRNTVNSYIHHFKPKKVSFTAYHDIYHDMYGQLGKQIARKHSGEYKLGKPSRSTGFKPIHNVTFPNHVTENKLATIAASALLSYGAYALNTPHSLNTNEDPTKDSKVHMIMKGMDKIQKANELRDKANKSPWKAKVTK